MPSVKLQTPLCVVQHVGETWKPTNTARLLRAMIPDLPVMPYGMREPAFDPGPVADDSIDWRILFLRDDAELVTDLPPPPEGRKRGFVLLDGTWHQCSRMARRAPGIGGLPCVRLPDGPPSIWRVRTQHDPKGVSTFEAALRLLSLVEGEEVVAPMWSAFEIVTARLLWLKGRLKTPDVPEDWDVALAEIDAHAKSL